MNVRPSALLEHARNMACLPDAFFREWRTSGARAALGKALSFRMVSRRYVYRQDPCPDAAGEMRRWDRRPRFSILMPVYNIAPRWLDLAVQSVRSQTYPDWELCIVDDRSTNAATVAYLKTLADPRIRVWLLQKNLGISGASNEAARLAGGDYVALLDHDDELTPDALLEMARAIVGTGSDLLYSDEDLIDGRGRAREAHFKPDYSPDLLLSHNYITHLLVADRGLFERTGGFRSEYDGAQDYDLVLRLAQSARRICHVRKVLYRWRGLKTSTSRSHSSKPYTAEAGRKAVEDALRRSGVDAGVEHGNLPNFYRVQRRLTSHPRVSIIIPFRDRPELLERCVGSVLKRSTYRDFEIIGADNGSEDPATLKLMERLAREDARIRFLALPGPFNYSRINNAAAREAAGSQLVLMNNDIEVLTPGWIEALLEHAERADVGAVGAKLYYGNGRIQHAGVIVGIGGFAGHSHRHVSGTCNGYMNRLNVIQNVSAVTGALLMVKKAVYEAAGGLDEVNLGTALNDVDFCLRLRERGLLNVFTPYCEAMHYESVSRGYETTPDRRERFEREVRWFQQRHRAMLEAGDPFYNRNLTRIGENFGYPFNEPPAGAPWGVYEAPEREETLPVA